MHNVSEAIVLAGGFGTRLRSVLPETPKPLAPIAGVPFLKILVEFLRESGIRRVLLSVGYKKELFYEFFAADPCGLEVVLVPEEKPLGTGGAIKNAMPFVESENVFVFNGDTFANLSLQDMADFHFNSKSDVTVAALQLPNVGRYGTLGLRENKITRFDEKSVDREGWINAGTYLLRKSLFRDVPEGENSSFERDCLPLWVGRYHVSAFKFQGNFLDLGVPEDYVKAQTFIPQWVHLAGNLR